jgi:hypothetical protein
VMERFKGSPILIYDIEMPYRPELLKKHEQFAQFFGGRGAVVQESAPTTT